VSRIFGWLAWLFVALLYSGAGGIARVLRAMRPRRAGSGDRAGPMDVLVIGTFYTRNWCAAHLTPLAQAVNVRRVFAVLDGPTLPISKVEYVDVWRRGRWFPGRTLGKLWTAWRVARRVRPAVVMGYHLVPGALSALLVARGHGAAASYQLTGGLLELEGGGAGAENPVLRRLPGPSCWLERGALALANQFDLLVVRGPRALAELRARGVGAAIRVIPGSSATAPEPAAARDCDVISVGRLVEVKQPQRVLQLAAALRDQHPELRVQIVGDGPLRAALEAEARQRGLQELVEFCGHRDDVGDLLARARVFVLTSRSEGLSLALAEAMAAGSVPVVADVGELAELVVDGVTGYRVTPGDIDAYVARIGPLLNDAATRARLSDAARARALAHMGSDAVRRRWEHALAAVAGGALPTPRAGRRGLPGPGLRRRCWAAMPAWARRAAAPLLAHIPPTLALGRAFREQLALAERSQSWSRDEQVHWQIARLRRLCAWAYEFSPWYRAHFEACGFCPQDLRTPADFERLPTCDARTLRAHADEMRVSAAAGVRAEFVSTGGTDGRPLRFAIDADRSAAEYAHLVASWQRAGYRPELSLAVFRGEVVAPDRTGLRHAWDPLLRRHLYSNFHMTDAEMRRYLAHVETIGPCFLLAYPSSSAALARCLARHQLPPPTNIRGILAGSENVYADERAFVEATFKARYFSWYGHSEKAVLAAECEHATTYHVWATYGYCELLDADGRAVTTPGQRGEIVGTSFINHALPLLRYRTGDTATYVGERCPACGRAALLLDAVRGHRTHELLVARDGALISWTAVNMHDRTFDAVRQFQFRQDTPGEAVLRVVPANGFDAAARQRLLADLGRKLAGRLAIRLEVAAAIPLTARGKATYVDQRLELDVQRAAEV
jgi:phenylacetate-CoA ligase